MSDAVSMSFKSRMNRMAKENGLRPQLVIQNFMFERFLERLSISPYRDNFVIKGGVLISAMVGIRARSTMDMDTTIVNLPLTFKSIRGVITRICQIDTGDNVEMSLLSIERIRLQIEGYGGIRAKLMARFHGLQVPFSMDVTSGEAIGAVEYAFRCQFTSDRTLSLMAYPVETILAEKCEAILRRNVVGTRPRDYYDVYLLTRTLTFSGEVFLAALRATCEACGTASLLGNISNTLTAITESPIQNDYWSRFQREFPYARGIVFGEAVASVRALMEGAQ